MLTLLLLRMLMLVSDGNADAGADACVRMFMRHVPFLDVAVNF